MTPKGTQNHPKSSQRARKQFLEVPRDAEVEKVSQKATKGYQKELIWEPLGLLFGTLSATLWGCSGLLFQPMHASSFKGNRSSIISMILFRFWYHFGAFLVRFC